MHTISGLHGSGPRPGFDFRNPLEKIFAERAVNRLWPREPKLSRQEAAFTQDGRVGRRIGSERVQGACNGIRGRRFAKIDLLEGKARLLAIGLFVVRKIGFQFARGRFQEVGSAVRQKFHFLLKPPTDHRVVAVKTKRQRFTVVDFLTHKAIDHDAQLVVGRRAFPHRLVARRQLFDLIGPDDDRVRLCGPRLRHHAKDEEQQGADRKEMQKRLPKEPLQGSSPWFLTTWAMIGGFGVSSDIDWDVLAGVGWRSGGR